MGQFSNSFPKNFSYLCEYAIRFDLSCSYCEYPAIFHCLHCSPSCFGPDSLLLAYLWLGLSWIDCISANKSFSSSKTSSRKPYTSSKQQERHKHSVEITINFSKCPKKSCPRVQIFRPHRLHCPLEDMSLLQSMNHLFTFFDSVFFKRKQEVLLSFTYGKQHCTEQRAFIIPSLHCLPGFPCPLLVLPSYTLSMYTFGWPLCPAPRRPVTWERRVRWDGGPGCGAAPFPCCRRVAGVREVRPPSGGCGKRSLGSYLCPTLWAAKASLQSLGVCGACRAGRRRPRFCVRSTGGAVACCASTLWQPSKASAQNSVLCSRESGSQHTVPKNQYHQRIRVRYQCLGTKLVSTHKLGGFLSYPQAGRVPTKHLARLGC